MANGATHSLVGAIAGVVACLGDDDSKKPEPYNLVTAGITGGVFAGLPDKLEPAFHPSHRQFFHSILILAMIAKGVASVYRWEPETKGEQLLRALLFVGGIAYASHLVLDGLTPKSIPFLGNT